MVFGVEGGFLPLFGVRGALGGSGPLAWRGHTPAVEALRVAGALGLIAVRIQPPSEVEGASRGAGMSLVGGLLALSTPDFDTKSRCCQRTSVYTESLTLPRRRANII